MRLRFLSFKGFFTSIKAFFISIKDVIIVIGNMATIAFVCFSACVMYKSSNEQRMQWENSEVRKWESETLLEMSNMLKNARGSLEYFFDILPDGNLLTAESTKNKNGDFKIKHYWRSSYRIFYPLNDNVYDGKPHTRGHPINGNHFMYHFRELNKINNYFVANYLVFKKYNLDKDLYDLSKFLSLARLFVSPHNKEAYTFKQDIYLKYLLVKAYCGLDAHYYNKDDFYLDCSGDPLNDNPDPEFISKEMFKEHGLTGDIDEDYPKVCVELSRVLFFIHRNIDIKIFNYDTKHSVDYNQKFIIFRDEPNFFDRTEHLIEEKK